MLQEMMYLEYLHNNLQKPTYLCNYLNLLLVTYIDWTIPIHKLILFQLHNSLVSVTESTYFCDISETP